MISFCNQTNLYIYVHIKLFVVAIDKSGTFDSGKSGAIESPLGGLYS